MTISDGTPKPPDWDRWSPDWRFVWTFGGSSSLVFSMDDDTLRDFRRYVEMEHDRDPDDSRVHSGYLHCPPGTPEDFERFRAGKQP